MVYLSKKSFEIFDDVMWDLKNNPKSPDAFGLIVGGNGKGKSNFGQAVGYDIDEKFGIEKIIFEKTEWELLKPKMKRGYVVVFDEGINIFFSRNAMTTDTKESVQEMAKIRSMGLFILVCIPNLRLLDWYIKSDRPHFIVRTNSPKFKLWSFMENEEQTEEEAYAKLQILLKEGFDSVEPDFIGKWSKVDGERWEKYEEKKRIQQIGDQKNIKIIKMKLKAKEERKNIWLVKDMSEKYGICKSTVHKYIDKFVPKKEMRMDLKGRKGTTMKGETIFEKKYNKLIKNRYKQKRRKKHFKRPICQSLKRKR